MKAWERVRPVVGVVEEVAPSGAADVLADELPRWLQSRDRRGHDDEDLRAARNWCDAMQGARRRGELADWVDRNRVWGRRVLAAVGVPGVEDDGARMTSPGALWEMSLRLGYRYQDKHDANG